MFNTGFPVKTNEHSQVDSVSPVQQLFYDFCRQTSLHGIRFVLNSWVSKPRRLIWLVVILVHAVGFGVVVVNQVLYVYQRPLLTKVVTRYVDRLAFPAVSICRENIVLEEFNSLNQSLSPDELAKMDVLKIAKERQLKLKDLVQGCVIANYYDCSADVTRMWSNNGLCYTINAAAKATKSHEENLLSKFVSTKAGIDSGLRLQLFMDPNYTTNSTIPSVSIILHEPDEKIFMANSEFVYVAGGTSNFIAVKVRRNKFLPPPFKAFGDKECFRTSGDYRHPLVPDSKYTLRACDSACYIQGVHAFCGCSVDIQNDDEFCDPLSYFDCKARYLQLLSNNSVATDSSCKCPFPCEEVIYDMALSSVPIGGQESNNSLAWVVIYFDRLRLESTEQVADYTTGDFFATIGGQMGLFLGASVITVMEILELTLRCGWTWVKKLTTNSVSNFEPDGQNK